MTLHSVNVSFPNSDRTFPGGAEADTINNDCLICHSAGMVLTQPSLSRAGWQDVVEPDAQCLQGTFRRGGRAGNRRLPRQPRQCKHSVAAQGPGRQPDPKHGAVIVAQGTAAGAPPCAQCHAFNGVSDAQRRISAARRPVGLLSCRAAARLCLGCASERHHVADRQGAVARRYSRCDGLLCGHRCAVSAAQSAQSCARQARRGARQGRRRPERLHCDNCHGPGGSASRR